MFVLYTWTAVEQFRQLFRCRQVRRRAPCRHCEYEAQRTRKEGRVVEKPRETAGVVPRATTLRDPKLFHDSSSDSVDTITSLQRTYAWSGSSKRSGSVYGNWGLSTVYKYGRHDTPGRLGITMTLFFISYAIARDQVRFADSTGPWGSSMIPGRTSAISTEWYTQCITRAKLGRTEGCCFGQV